MSDSFCREVSRDFLLLRWKTLESRQIWIKPGLWPQKLPQFSVSLSPFFNTSSIFNDFYSLSLLPISRFFLAVPVFLLASATLALHDYFDRGVEIYIRLNFAQTSKVKLSKKKTESR